jgi:ketosteroid isomerase-like protein
MSERADNERLLRAGIEAYNRGDVEAMADFFDPGIELYIDTAQGNSGSWQGLDGYREMVTAWQEAFAETRSELLDVDMVDDHNLVAAMRQTAVGAGSGVPVEMTNYYLLEVRAGRAVRFHIYGDRESAVAAARE